MAQNRLFVPCLLSNIHYIIFCPSPGWAKLPSQLSELSPHSQEARVHFIFLIYNLRQQDSVERHLRYSQEAAGRGFGLTSLTEFTVGKRELSGA